MQQFLALLGALGTVLALIARFLTGPASAENELSPVALPDAPTIILTDGLDDVHINGITVGQPLDEIRALHDDFPETGVSVFLETGEVRTRYDFENTEYYAVDGTITRIRVPHTPQGIRPGSSLAEASSVYGRPVHGYSSSNGRRYAVYSAAENLNLAWVFEYRDRVIQRIYLENCLEQRRRDAVAAHPPTARPRGGDPGSSGFH
ncbi:MULTISPECIES: hypothetical protein [unclassified Corynebacterium]|uniref:hypothetical protein n=1 Tax=unclassified Corynebacterium TaxID=2624378 RepID=UPI003524BAEC